MLDIIQVNKFPTLFKKNSKGTINEWTISVKGNEVTVVFGQVDGKLQETTDIISEGKNVGKSNETTPNEQALAEAKAKWEKQLKKGYIENIEAASAGEVDDIIQGGIIPMLAHKFSDHGHKIQYPAYVQPKLDGIRCIAILKNGKCTLWTRTRKPITSVPHIIKEIETRFHEDIVLDGELYNHEFKNNFEHIVSLVRQESPAENHTDVQYHIYDIVNDKPFSSRAQNICSYIFFGNGHTYIKWVYPENALYEAQAIDYNKLYKKQGYEGAMIRNANGLYINKRSYDLQKLKDFTDDEFEIVGIEEGRGKLSGHVGAFICKTSAGDEFRAKMSGETEKLREYYKYHKLWKNKTLTVKYQGLTSKGIPRFPVGLAIRDYE